MSLFKKKIEFPQFIADTMFNEFAMYKKHIDDWILKADEYGVLTKKDREGLRELGKSLIVVDIYLNGIVNFNGSISPEDISKVTSILYLKYLKEFEKLSEQEISKRTKGYIALLEKTLENAKEDTEDDMEELHFALCSSFASIYTCKEDLTSKVAEGKNFASFKLANSLTRMDLMKTMLNEYKVSI